MQEDYKRKGRPIPESAKQLGYEGVNWNSIYWGVDVSKLPKGLINGGRRIREGLEELFIFDTQLVCSNSFYYSKLCLERDNLKKELEIDLNLCGYVTPFFFERVAQKWGFAASFTELDLRVRINRLEKSVEVFGFSLKDMRNLGLGNGHIRRVINRRKEKAQKIADLTEGDEKRQWTCTLNNPNY
jgi:hypothetical protein